MRVRGPRVFSLLLLTVCSTAYAGVTQSVAPVGDRRSPAAIQQELAYTGYTSHKRQIKHVSLKGSDTSGDGSQKRPWRSVARAVRSLKPGDTLYIHAGTYPDTQVDLAAAGAVAGRSDAPITLMRAPGEARPVLQSSGAGPLFTLNRPYWILDGLELDGRWEPVSSVHFLSHHNTLRDSLVRDSGKDAVVVQGHTVSIEDNLIRNTFEAVPGTLGPACTSHASCAPGSFCKPEYDSGGTVRRSCRQRDDGHAISIVSNAYGVLVRGNVIQDSTGDGLQCAGPLQGYISGNRPVDITLEDNDISTSPAHYGVTENAVDVKDCDFVTLRRERYHGFRPVTEATGGASGDSAVVFHFSAQGVLMEDSEVSDVCLGLSTGNSAEDTVANVVIRRNRFHGVLRDTGGCGANPAHGSALVLERLTHGDIHHNTLANIPYRALVVGGTWLVSDVDFWNNIVTTTSPDSSWVAAVSANLSGFDAGPNLYWNAGGAQAQFLCEGAPMDLATWRTSSCAGGSDFEARSSAGVAPGFVNPAAGDFQLQSTSPAIDAALHNTAASFCGAAPDLGALERCQGG